MDNEIKIIELFGGIGALTQAFTNSGIPHRVVDYVEIDKYAVKSYNAMNGTNFEPQDICTWDKDIEVDLIMHGSPCQDFSVAGQGKGGDKDSGTRSSLMYETLRIVGKLKPKYVIWENVKNLISKKHRHNFDAYLSAMEQMGYKNYYQVLNAKDYGIPQNRERIFTISILDNHTEVVKDFEFPKPRELTSKLENIVEIEVDEKYYLSEEKINKIAHWKAYQKPFERVLGKNSIVPTLTARGAGEEHSGMITYCDKLEDTTNLQEECMKIGLFDDTSSDNFAKGKRDYGYKDEYGTLKCNPKYSIYKSTDLRIRKITPREAWRLMGFSDQMFERASSSGNSNTQLYKQAGNSIVVPVLEAIIKQLPL